MCRNIRERLREAEQRQRGKQRLTDSVTGTKTGLGTKVARRPANLSFKQLKTFKHLHGINVEILNGNCETANVMNRKQRSFNQIIIITEMTGKKCLRSHIKNQRRRRKSTSEPFCGAVFSVGGGGGTEREGERERGERERMTD